MMMMIKLKRRRLRPLLSPHLPVTRTTGPDHYPDLRRLEKEKERRRDITEGKNNNEQVKGQRSKVNNNNDDRNEQI